jgi:hypothetical protein
MTTEERLEELQRQFARAKRQTLWMAAVGVAVAVGLGLALLGTWTKTTAIVHDQGAGDGPKVIRARGISLEDEDGKVRAMWAVPKEGPQMKLFDENEEMCALLTADKDGPRFTLCDQNNGKGLIQLMATSGGPCMILTGRDHKPRLMLSVAYDRPRLTLTDEKAQIRAALGARETTMPDGTELQHPESSLWLFGPDGKALWSAP